MPRNTTDRLSVIATVDVPGGGRAIELDGADVLRYAADPDAFVAEQFGLSKLEYLQWVDLDGAPLCGCQTAGGDLCRNQVGRSQQDAGPWKAAHRKMRCVAHGGDSRRAEPAKVLSDGAP